MPPYISKFMFLTAGTKEPKPNNENHPHPTTMLPSPNFIVVTMQSLKKVFVGHPSNPDATIGLPDYKTRYYHSEEHFSTCPQSNDGELRSTKSFFSNSIASTSQFLLTGNFGFCRVPDISGTDFPPRWHPTIHSRSKSLSSFDLNIVSQTHKYDLTCGVTKNIRAP
ncbi:hypothetical protein TNCV_4113381 [Trichonephila clavipes]|nr:hypothetical protein TNCV_4113381 [Trichonephila clavipes]